MEKTLNSEVLFTQNNPTNTPNPTIVTSATVTPRARSTVIHDLFSQEATPTPNEFTHSIVSPLVNQTIEIVNQDLLPNPETPILNAGNQ